MYVDSLVAWRQVQTQRHTSAEKTRSHFFSVAPAAHSDILSPSSRTYGSTFLAGPPRASFRLSSDNIFSRRLAHLDSEPQTSQYFTTPIVHPSTPPLFPPPSPSINVPKPIESTFHRTINPLFFTKTRRSKRPSPSLLVAFLILSISNSSFCFPHCCRFSSSSALSFAPHPIRSSLSFGSLLVHRPSPFFCCRSPPSLLEIIYLPDIASVASRRPALFFSPVRAPRVILPVSTRPILSI